MVDKKIVDGKTAVLVSPGYGAGWSSWNSSNADFMAMDKGLVELAMQGAKQEEVENYLKEVFGSKKYICALGWSDVEVVWLEQGTQFRIDEYDGFESLEKVANVDWMVA